MKLKQSKKTPNRRRGGGKQRDQNAANANRGGTSQARRTTHALRTKVAKNAKAG